LRREPPHAHRAWPLAGAVGEVIGQAEFCGSTDRLTDAVAKDHVRHLFMHIVFLSPRLLWHVISFRFREQHIVSPHAAR
jgi:hypothetical protein